LDVRLEALHLSRERLALVSGLAMKEFIHRVVLPVSVLLLVLAVAYLLYVLLGEDPA
jgi:hypothetical protein